MRKGMQVLFTIAVLLLAISVGVSASEYSSARAYAMGGAYTALASDLSALQINPAGLGQTDFEVAAGACVNNLELISASGSDDVWQIAADEDLKLHGQAGLRIGGFGLGAFANAALMKQVDAASGDDIVVQDINGRASIGYGTRLTELFNLRIGGSVDVIQGRQDVFYADTNTATIESRIDSEWQGYSVNAGLMAKVGPLRAGLAVNDIYSSIDKKKGAITVTEKLDPSYRAGVALELDAITLAADYELPPGTDQGILHMGAETRLLFNLLSVRAGQVVYPDQTRLTTAGIGINFAVLHADLSVSSEDMFQSNEFSQVRAQVTMSF
jgi:hypothetical protein